MKPNNLIKSITAFVLVIAMAVGMAVSLGKRATASGGWKVTIKFYNGESDKSYTIPNNYTLKLPTPAPTSGTFLYWKCGSSTYKAGQIITVKNNMAIEGIWEVSVSFISNGTSIVQKQKTGYKYILPSAASKSGYILDYWADSNGKKITTNTVVTNANTHKVTAHYRLYPECEKASNKIDKILHGIYDPKGAYKNTNQNYFFNMNSGKNWGYVKQCTNVNPDPDGERSSNDTKDYSCGMCTICAIANLLNRKSVYMYGECRFSFEESVITALYPDSSGGKYGWQTRKYSTSGSNRYSYYLKHNSKENYSENTIPMMSGKGNFKLCSTTISGDLQTRKKTLCNLLDAHPEGIAIHSTFNSGQHACVITYYKQSANPNNIEFCAIDTAGGIRDYYSTGSLTSQYICTYDGYSNNINGANHAIEKIDRVWYIK